MFYFCILGDYESTIGIQNLLINKFPNDVTYRNDLIVTLFMLNRFVITCFFFLIHCHYKVFICFVFAIITENVHEENVI